MQSIHLRLLATYPALNGHGYNFAVDGTSVDDLPDQVSEMLAQARPLPDLVVIMSLDHDIACDGTDPANYGPYPQKLDAVLTSIERADEGVRIYVPDQAVRQTNYNVALAQDPALLQTAVGTGPCDPANRRADATESLQKIDNCAMYQWACARRDHRPKVPLDYLAAKRAPWSGYTDFPASWRKAIVPLQKSYAASWSPGRFEWIDSGHEIHLERPDAVASAIRWVRARM